jgi:hypothetical protein
VAVRVSRTYPIDFGAKCLLHTPLTYVRWALPGKGKSGGIRVMYYWRLGRDQIYLLYLFRKGIVLT